MFKNIFEIAPKALQLFSFKDEENLYENPKLIKHGVGVMKFFDIAIDNFESTKGDLTKLGNRHFARGIKIPHYAVVGEALM